MMEALALAGGISTAIAIVGVLILALKLSGAKDETLAANSNALAEKERGDTYKQGRDADAEVIAKRDAEALVAANRIAELESERNDLAKKLSEAKVAELAATPVGDRGAAAVNDMFSQPLLPAKEPPK